jgi:hypothetical protein
MAGQERESSPWYQSLGLELLLPIVCPGFRRSLISVKKLRIRDPCLTNLALDPAWHTCMSRHVSK